MNANLATNAAYYPPPQYQTQPELYSPVGLEPVPHFMLPPLPDDDDEKKDLEEDKMNLEKIKKELDDVKQKLREEKLLEEEEDDYVCRRDWNVGVTASSGVFDHGNKNTTIELQLPARRLRKLQVTQEWDEECQARLDEQIRQDLAEQAEMGRIIRKMAEETEVCAQEQKKITKWIDHLFDRVKGQQKKIAEIRQWNMEFMETLRNAPRIGSSSTSREHLL